MVDDERLMGSVSGSLPHWSSLASSSFHFSNIKLLTMIVPIKNTVIAVVVAATVTLLAEAGRHHYKMRMKKDAPRFFGVGAGGGGLGPKDYLKSFPRGTSQPTEMPTASPSSSPSSRPSIPREEQNQLVTCISVIDENDGRSLQSEWNELKQKYPNRPLCVLRPVPQSVGLWLPDDFLTTSMPNVFATTTRGGNDVTNPANWFDLCNLEAGKAQGLTNVLLFVDESGSMDRTDVDTALALFQQETMLNGFTIVDTVYNQAEDWVTPCLSTDL